MKPENILLSAQNIVKIADFGISKLVNAKNIDVSTKGTPLYMDPLLRKGHKYKAPEKIDVWSFGLILYHAYVGKHAIQAKHEDELAEFHRNRKMIDIPSHHFETHNKLSEEL